MVNLLENNKLQQAADVESLPLRQIGFCGDHCLRSGARLGRHERGHRYWWWVTYIVPRDLMARRSPCSQGIMVVVVM
jgi:hypothetical protein